MIAVDVLTLNNFADSNYHEVCETDQPIFKGTNLKNIMHHLSHNRAKSFFFFENSSIKADASRGAPGAAPRSQFMT